MSNSNNVGETELSGSSVLQFFSSQPSKYHKSFKNTIVVEAQNMFLRVHCSVESVFVERSVKDAVS